MKTIHLTAFLIFILQQISFGQWEEIYVPTEFGINSVHFIDDNNGFVVGGSEIFKTINGGGNWEESFTTNSTLILEDVFITTQDNIYAVGKDFDLNQSVIIKTTDSGSNWDLIYLENNSLLVSIYFTSPSTGYCSGRDGVIFKTIDSGDTWQELNTGTSQNLQSIYFVNDTIGIAVGGSPSNSLMLKTQNAGQDWTPVNIPSDNYLQSVFFTSTQIGYVVGWNGEIMKTVDCGNTWNSQNSINLNSNHDIFFTDENTGYIVGGEDSSSIQKTINGGDSWEDISPALDKVLLGVYFSSDNVGYVVGGGGTVIKTESAGIISSTNNISLDLNILLYPNPSTHKVSIESINNEIYTHIKIYNSEGKLVSMQKVSSTNFELDLSQYQSGLYYVEFTSKNGRSIHKVIKK